MTRGEDEASDRLDRVIAPFVALVFSIIVMAIASRYPSWFGALPAMTVVYLKFAPAWIALNVVAIAVHAIVASMKLTPGQGGMWSRLDGTLALASLLSVLAGIVALLLPVMHVH